MDNDILFDQVSIYAYLLSNNDVIINFHTVETGVF